MPKEQELTSIPVYIGLGSNLEPRLDYMRSAVERIRAFGEDIQMSHVYETAPVGGIPQPDYLNAALRCNTSLGPLELFQELKKIEREVGRTVRPRWHEREIDLDLLFYEDLVLESTDLTVPHSEIARRGFVLKPLADLDANFVHPALHKTISDLLESVDLTGIHRTELELA